MRDLESDKEMLDRARVHSGGSFQGFAFPALAYYISEVERLKTDNSKMRECLEWYRDKAKNYVESYGAQPNGIGKRASACLSILGGADNGQ